ncbi:hypothetical protein [Photobacterium sp. 1_MG-2023]|uniref:hypothetical protein n=1 Tax=Photobacterium sp. 1_MG-2023 TaxID=3062646 RepID=UPI0026E3B9C4|nr:hypothetical protein [Photobacterium sp. 1_MG-2023]MDO6705566.1 hypothetical protein [Photobacterium sp. 1_MG-2023]
MKHIEGAGSGNTESRQKDIIHTYKITGITNTYFFQKPSWFCLKLWIFLSGNEFMAGGTETEIQITASEFEMKAGIDISLTKKNAFMRT